MSDFDDLRQIREAKEKSEALKRQKEQEKYRLQDEAARRLADKKRATADELNNTVVDVLEALRDALYPGLEVQRHNLVDRVLGVVHGWGIGRVAQNGFWVDELIIVVHVQFDKRGEAKRFVCYKPQSGRSETKFVRSGLSRDDLVRALKKLHVV